MSVSFQMIAYIRPFRFNENTKLIFVRKQSTAYYLQNILLVALGAASYGILATMVRLAYRENYSTEEVVFAQYALGVFVLGIWLIIQPKTKKQTLFQKATPKQVVNLLATGTSTGFTGVFYYISIQYAPVSICIILLMQSIWMGLALDYIFNRRRPSVQAVLAVGIVLIGTYFATQASNGWNSVHPKGIFWGLLAALSYAVTLFAGNRVAVDLSSSQRSFWMLLGGFCIVLLYVFPALINEFHWSVFQKWGILLALFGTIIPPVLMNKGLPIVGMAVGSILSSIEIPVSILSAALLLGEQVSATQWLGAGLILVAVIAMNWKRG